VTENSDKQWEHEIVSDIFIWLLKIKYKTIIRTSKQIAIN